VLFREIELDVLPLCARLGMTVVPYFPAGVGVLTGKYKRGAPLPAHTRLGQQRMAFMDKYVSESSLQKVWALEDFAATQGHTVLELALSWLTRNTLVASIIMGATQPQQVAINTSAAGSWQLSAEDLAMVDSIVGASSA
jgi:aryl-alcohol dehydrogenase-like predicted oxidoreductase